MKALHVGGSDLRQALHGLRSFCSDDANDKGRLARDSSGACITPLSERREHGQPVRKTSGHLSAQEVRPLCPRDAAAGGDITSKEKVSLQHRLAVDLGARRRCVFGQGRAAVRNEDKPDRGLDQYAHEAQALPFRASTGQSLGRRGPEHDICEQQHLAEHGQPADDGDPYQAIVVANQSGGDAGWDSAAPISATVVCTPASMSRWPVGTVDSRAPP